MDRSGFSFLALAGQRGETFDVIFLDPPYEKGWVVRTVEIIAEERLLAPEGVVVAEHSVRETVRERYGPLVLRDQRRYGSTALSFFELQHTNHQTEGEETRGTNRHRNLPGLL